ncbi:alpha/beta hydrolase [Pedobacter aquatilis]|uniref:alpha/beta fold hydrolase n=1 Tax=Pedobacter aquatilis TaxID=351343 RepID=UPI0025B61873|nr:alpha/beta hydrolase [Pedobacter aquatilis]MDN3587564.1 alpha/beta hydrolase [Pedobacter aquatilis]
MNNILKRNHVNIIGKGEKVLMMAHGFGCDQSTWKFITSAFLDDYKIILFDYVGSGKSEINQYDYHKYSSLEGYACDVVDIIEVLKLKDIVFIGHSVSAMIGMLAAIQIPEAISKLIFIGPSPKYINENEYFGGFEREQVEGLFKYMADDYIGWSKYLAPNVMGNLENPEHAEFLQECFESMNPKIALEFAMATFNCDYRNKLQELKTKSITLMNDNDMIVPLQVGDFIKRHTPYNTLHLLNATGHYPHISAPEETIKAIKLYLNEKSNNTRNSPLVSQSIDL